MGCGVCDATFRLSLWQLAGIPVIGSRRLFKCAMVHDGDTRRSEDAFSDVMSKGTSAAVLAMVIANGVLTWCTWVRPLGSCVIHTELQRIVAWPTSMFTL